MMHELNRDLLVLSRSAQLNQAELSREASLLNALLYHFETWENFCKAHELVDINRRRIVSRPYQMQNILHNHPQKAFIFINNKN